MKVVIIIFFISTYAIAGWQPSTFTNESVFTNAIRPFKRYMEKLNRNYIVDIKDDHIMFYKQAHYTLGDQFEVFIDRKTDQGAIETRLEYYHENNYAGSIILTRKGKNVQPLSNMDLVLFNFTLDSSLENFKLDFTHFGSIIDYTNDGSEKLTTYIIHGNNRLVTANVREYETADEEERRFWWNCGECNGDPALGILQKKDQSVRYYGKVGKISGAPIVAEDDAKSFFTRTANYQSGIIDGINKKLKFAKDVFTWPNEEGEDP